LEMDPAGLDVETYDLVDQMDPEPDEEKVGLGLDE